MLKSGLWGRTGSVFFSSHFCMCTASVCVCAHALSVWTVRTERKEKARSQSAKPVILAPREAEAKGSQIQGQDGPASE